MRYFIAYPNGMREDFEYAGDYHGRPLIIVNEEELHLLRKIGCRVNPLQQCYDRFACVVDADQYAKEKGRAMGWDRHPGIASPFADQLTATTYATQRLSQYAVKTYADSIAKAFYKSEPDWEPADSQKEREKKEELAHAKKKKDEKDTKHKKNIRTLYWARQKHEDRQTTKS